MGDLLQPQCPELGNGLLGSVEREQSHFAQPAPDGDHLEIDDLGHPSRSPDSRSRARRPSGPSSPRAVATTLASPTINGLPALRAPPAQPPSSPPAPRFDVRSLPGPIEGGGAGVLGETGKEVLLGGLSGHPMAMKEHLLRRTRPAPPLRFHRSPAFDEWSQVHKAHKPMPLAKGGPLVPVSQGTRRESSCSDFTPLPSRSSRHPTGRSPRGEDPPTRGPSRRR